MNTEKLRNALPLIGICLACIGILYAVNHITKDKIAINKERAALSIITEVIPEDYDNDLFNDKIKVEVPPFINPTNTITVHRARKNDEAIAVALMPIITKGYNGNINLIVGIDYHGNLTGVKVLQHNETEGFGDQAHQDKSNWLLKFSGYNLNNTKKEQWATKKDDGDFDQLSGATITSRSIINILYKTLNYYMEHKEKFYVTE